MEHRSLPIFPIPIGLYNFGEDQHALNVRLISDILTEQSEDPQGQVRSNMGGWHSADYQEKIHKDSFGRLSAIIEEKANHYCKLHGYKTGLISSNLWANINESGDFNLSHHHGASALTGVYYPAGSIVDGSVQFNYSTGVYLKPGTWDGEHGGSIVLYDPAYSQKTKLVKDCDNPSPYTFDTYYTYPIAGLLILFPSYIIHTVTPFKENMKRVSISFVLNYGKT
tara:strand:+ start:254 stop:925 length:672 start_codon:yes stop_codon:yes gene_type:complete